MKNTLLVLLFSLTVTYSSFAGCAGVCISSDPSMIYGTNDTVYIAPNGNGQATLYAHYNSCCNSLFGGNASLIWCRNGIAYDTTSSWTSVNFMFTQQLTVSQPGVYSVFFSGFFFPNNPAYVCGTVTVLLRDQQAATSPATVMETKPANVSSVALFPNPAKNTVQINTVLNSSGRFSIHIYSYTGQIYFASEESVSEGVFSKTIDISALPDGIYMVRIESPQAAEIQKFVKTNGY
ncbi:MAG: hypothetical protein FD123_341 [Bacteroidetes bacterium]|nr:MAG: hypothetical protein FD123_341 [Bacteroidota bacterium]